MLRKQHINESFDILREDIMKLDQAVSGVSYEMRTLLHSILQEKNPNSFMENAQSEVVQGKAEPQTLEKLVYLILAYTHYKNNFYSKFQESHWREINYEETAK
ncbi:MAG: hypothetical protein MZU91_03790 [Desulfosudis oleivorans]|nr:hypothetical protein [Desulfosudis oleivorans]